MHTSFVDKKRRDLNLREMQVENVLPEHFAEYYPKFIALLERYYEFQDQDDSTELIKHLFASRDINETDITLLEYIEDELLLGKAYFKGFGSNETELRAAANFSNTMFRSKGTKFAIEWFFRSFYGEDVEVLYPKENIFLVGVDDSQIGADSLRYLTDDKLYQTFALLIRVGISISKWKEVFKLFVHPAGMYLGGEVLIVDDVETNVVTLNDVIDQYTTPTYVMDVGSGEWPEGGRLAGWSVQVGVNGTNVRNNGTDVVYWWGEHVDTTDSDFTSQFPLYDSDNKQYVNIDASVGSFKLGFTVEPESLPAEGNETFNIFLGDRSGRLLDQKTITIADVIPNWTIERTPTGTVAEGTQITFTVTGENPEYIGNSELYWYLDTTASTAGTADFEGSVPTTFSNAEQIPITISPNGELYPGAEGTFSVIVKLDALVDDLETAVFRVANANGIVVASETITLANALPTLAVSVADITEGSDIVANVTADLLDIGKLITYQISGSDARIPVKSGNILLDAENETITLSTISDPAFQGDQTYTFTITDATIGYSPSDTFVISDATANYVLSGDPSVGIEGSSVTYTVSGENLPDGSVWFYIANAAPNPTDDNDWTVAPPRDGSRQEIVISGGTGSFTLTYATNGDTSAENYEAYIYDAETGGTELASLSRIIGTPITVTPNKTVVEENDTLIGRTVTFDVSTAGVIPDGTYNYQIVPLTGYPIGIDFESGTNLNFNNLSGTFDISSESGTIEIVVADDLRRDAAETWRVDVKDGNNVVGSSPTISVGAESVPKYSFFTYTDATGTTPISTQTELDNIYFGITPTYPGQVEETLYIEVVNSGSQFSTTQQTVTLDGSSDEIILTFPTNGDNGIYGEPDRTVNIYITLSDYQTGPSTGILINIIDLVITDPVGTTWALTADDPQPAPSITTTEYDLTPGNETYWEWLEANPDDLYQVLWQGAYISPESGGFNSGQSGFPGGQGTPSSVTLSGITYNQGDYQQGGTDKFGTFEYFAVDRVEQGSATVTFTVSGTNITNGTYAYKPTNFFAKVVSANVPGGSVFIPLNNTTGLTVGMSAKATLGAAVAGKIVSVGSSGVVMESPVAPIGISQGATILFGPDEDWGWFDTPFEAFGTVNVSSNSGTFEIDFQSQNGNKTFIIGLYETLLDDSLVDPNATETILIQGPSNFTFIPYPEQVNGYLFTGEPNQEKLGRISFLKDGRVFGDNTVETVASEYEEIGNWIEGNFNSDDFKIRADIIDGPNGFVAGQEGSFGTDINFSDEPEDSVTFGLTAFGGSQPSVREANMTIRVTITSLNDSSLTYQQDVLIRATVAYVSDLF